MLLHTRPVTPVTERLHTPAPLPLPACQAHAARVWWPVNSIRLPASLHNNNERSDSRADRWAGGNAKRGLPPEVHTGSHCVTAGRPNRQHQRQGRPSRTPHTHAPPTHASMDDGERYISSTAVCIVTPVPCNMSNCHQRSERACHRHLWLWLWFRRPCPHPTDDSPAPTCFSSAGGGVVCG